MGLGVGTSSDWDISTLASFQKKEADEIEWLWTAELPTSRDMNPAVWESITGFFEEAIVSSCSRSGHLVVTPRELLKQLKYNGREPTSGLKVINELFIRGDIIRAPNSNNVNTTSSTSTFGSIRSTLQSYLWKSNKPNVPSLDDTIVSTAALQSIIQRAEKMEGVTSSSEIHTVKTFAQAVTNGNIKDAETVIHEMNMKGKASVIKEGEENKILGVRIGNEVNESDKGVLRTKSALEKMQDMQIHFQQQIEKETTAAKEAALKGNKTEALLRLKKKKTLEAKLVNTTSSAAKLNDVLMAVDEAHSNKEAVSALETGMASLKLATQDGVTADRIDDVANALDEAMNEQQEVRAAFETLNLDIDGSQAELEEDLAKLMEPEKEKEEGEKVSTSTSAKLVDEAELELEKLMQELPTPLSPGKENNNVSDAIEKGIAEGMN